MVSNSLPSLKMMMLPWGENTTLSEELTRESASRGVPRILLAVQVVVAVMMMMISPSQRSCKYGPSFPQRGKWQIVATFSMGQFATKWALDNWGPIADDDDDDRAQGIVRSVNQLVRAVPQSNHAQTQANQAIPFPTLGANSNCPTIPG